MDRAGRLASGPPLNYPNNPYLTDNSVTIFVFVFKKKKRIISDPGKYPIRFQPGTYPKPDSPAARYIALGEKRKSILLGGGYKAGEIGTSPADKRTTTREPQKISSFLLLQSSPPPPPPRPPPPRWSRGASPAARRRPLRRGGIAV